MCPRLGFGMYMRRSIAASLVAASSLLMWLPGPALANGVGDLYVASPSGVLEVHVKTSTVVSTIDIVPAPQALAFSPDGRNLFVASGGAHVTPVDIATLEVLDSIAMPGEVTGLTFPSGQTLVGTMPARRSLVFVTMPAEQVTESAQLPGPGNLLAGDRHDPRVAVAEAGNDWLEIVDSASSSFKSTTLEGEIRALAIDRDRGGVLVATHNPDEVLRVDLTTLTVTWQTPLPGTPTAVASLNGMVIVGGGTNLWRAESDGAIRWATARHVIAALVPSDEGQFLHAQEEDGIEVFDSKGGLQRTLELTGQRAPSAMAAVPGGSSLYLGEGQHGSSSATPAPTGNAPKPTAQGGGTDNKPPSTNTVIDNVGTFVSQPPVQGALAVGVIILLICWMVVYRHDKRAKQKA